MAHHDIKLRALLSNGDILLIQRVKRKYHCFVVPAAPFEPPVYLVQDGTLDHCRQVAADHLEADVLEIDL